MMRNNIAITLRRKQMLGLIILGLVILVFQIGFSWWKNIHPSQPIELKYITESTTSPLSVPLSKFDPNDLDEKQWQNLGFSPKQVKTILNYKQSLGGEFLSKEQLKKCYAITEKKFEELTPYILLPDTNHSRSKITQQKDFLSSKELVVNKKFNPDAYTKEGWMRIGFTERQATTLLNYKNYLGGCFKSKEKFRECFAISEKNYNKLSPYLLLPEMDKNEKMTAENRPNHVLQSQSFDPNDLDLEGWKRLGFSEKQANTILKYKEKVLGGTFKTLEDIKKCYVISEEKFIQLKLFIIFKKGYKTTKSFQKENNKTTIDGVDLNKITFQQLVDSGFEKKTAAIFLNYRKKLGGFVEASQILEIYTIDKNLAEKLIQSSTLNSSYVPKYSLNEAPEEWLKSHPYFKYHADKIMYYRVSYQGNEKILKQLKLSTDKERKMRLYLK